MLRPLLDDLVREESCLEIRNATNQPGELAFAIRLNDERAGLWQTNLAAALESLTGVRPTVSPENRRGWSLKKPHAPNFIELTRVGEWTVVGLAQEKNALLGEFTARIQRSQTPFAGPATNDWLEAELDLRRIASALSLAWNPPGNWPKISLAVTGDGENVSAHGDLNFPKPLPFELEPWQIPTNLIREPLAGFTAIRGIAPWLAPLKAWKDLQLGAPPNQFFFWARQDLPGETYFAIRRLGASNEVRQLAGVLVEKGNPWLAANGEGHFEFSPDSNDVFWKGVPFMTPFLQSTAEQEGNFVFGGLLPDAGAATNSPPPVELVQQIQSRTNLVCYDWEITGARLDAWIYIGQTFRLALHKAQFPTDSPAWPGSGRPRPNSAIA